VPTGTAKYDTEALSAADASGTAAVTASFSTAGTDEVVLAGYCNYGGGVPSNPLINGAAATALISDASNNGSSWYKIQTATFSNGTATGTISSSAYVTVALAFSTTESEGGGAATLTQEGYRWRIDDGDQANATWAVAQDTGITAPANTVRRLRVIIDSSGDANAAQFQLEYKEANDANYTKVS
jgi:hypothetical protein